MMTGVTALLQCSPIQSLTLLQTRSTQRTVHFIYFLTCAGSGELSDTARSCALPLQPLRPCRGESLWSSASPL